MDEERDKTVYSTDKKNENTGAYALVSLTGYLCGVKEYFYNDETNPAMLRETFDRLETLKPARIVRNLCLIRIGLLQNYGRIFTAFGNFHNLLTIPEYIPPEAVTTLEEDGVRINKAHMDINECLVEVNRQISDKIANVRSLYPSWVNWEYIKDIFLMPNGTKKESLHIERDIYNADWDKYPYRCYLNLHGTPGRYMFYDDSNFVEYLYRIHGDEFKGDDTLLRSTSGKAKDTVSAFFDNARKVFVAVDCENADPVRLAAALSEFPDDEKKKIKAVTLFDSSYTSAGWDTLDSVSEETPHAFFDWRLPGLISGLPMEHEVVGRVVEHKSLVDMRLAVAVTEKALKEGYDSCILVSSDSDYYALIKSLPETKFLIMMEHKKAGDAIQDRLYQDGVPYCFLDEFNTSLANDIKTVTVQHYIENYLTRLLPKEGFRELIEKAAKDSWISLSEDEAESFMDRFMKSLSIVPDGEDAMKIEFSSQPKTLKSA